MDSWRLNLIPGYWVPSYIYSEEGDFSYGAKDKMAFKAQSRIWGYDLKKERQGRRTHHIEGRLGERRNAGADRCVALEAQRQWQQQAEDNVIERLQESGLVAPDGEVDKVLQTVINNLDSHQQHRIAASRADARDAHFSAGNFQRGQHYRRQPWSDRRAS